MSATSAAAPAPQVRLLDSPSARRIVLLAELVLLCIVVDQARIISPAFSRMFQIALAGAVINEAVPRTQRPAFFLLLSLVCTASVLRMGPTLGLIGAGLAMIGVCHLPARVSYRIALLLAIGAGLATFWMLAARLPARYLDYLLTLPVLASMFIFRLSIYLYDKENSKQPVPRIHTLNYFFMLPNVCFPLFPVIDYTTFIRSYRESDRWRTQQKGVHFMVEGILHLLTLRLVELYVARDPNQLVSRWDHLLYIVSAYLMYLRVSGQFHIAVGMLQLFGYELPRTHNNYFLASSFADLWRRLNIYWMEYMRKMVYYPVALRLRRLGPAPASIIATICVFSSTIVLHAYQFFWLTGSFHISSRDLLFWGLLCAFVIFDMERERRSASAKRPRLLSQAGPTRPTLAHAWGVARTLLIMTVLWSLWSSEAISLKQWLEILRGAVAP
jgi:D-alanyl-lipoteichoic acid acyltransferase DltB (MBOAT superfamily)